MVGTTDNPLFGQLSTSPSLLLAGQLAPTPPELQLQQQQSPAPQPEWSSQAQRNSLGLKLNVESSMKFTVTLI
jgi:hypothetical protein